MKKIDIEKGSKRADARFRITVEETGPYLVYGQPPLAQQFIMPDAEGESWYFQQGAHFPTDDEPTALCRCGASKNKPYCDGSHNEVQFRASGEPETRPSEPLARRGGEVDIEPETNGPLVVSGNLELCCGTGRTINRVTSTRLCRCGGSANKPYCDNTHRSNGFRS